MFPAMSAQGSLPGAASPFGTGQAYGPGGFATVSAPLPASSSLAAPVPSLPGSMNMIQQPLQLPAVYGTAPPSPPTQTLPTQQMPLQTMPPQVMPPTQSMPPGSQSMMMPPGSPRTGMMMPPGEPVGPGVITTASMTPPTPPPPPVVSRVGEPQPGEIIIEVTRLLDMPVQESMFGGGLKQYRVRATDGDGVYLDQTDELSGIPENPNAPEDEETETLRLGLEGVLRFRTHDPVIFLTVEYAGGFTGNTRIGRCRIHRGDPRCKQVWPYALSTRDGDPVGCGIELKVVDGGPPAMSMPMMPPPPMGTTGMPPMGGPPPLATMPPMGGPPPPTATVGPSFHTMPPQELAAMMSQPGGPMSVEGPPGTMQTPSYRLTDPKDLERIQPPEGTMNPLNAPPNLQPPPTDQSFKTMSPEEMQRLAGYQTASPWDAAISQHRTSMSGKAQQEQQAGNIPVVAYIELERVVDLVAPMGSTPFPGAKSSTAGEQVVITLEPAREATVNDKRVQNLMDSIRENPAQTQQLMAQIRRIQGDLGVGKEVLDRSGPFESEMRVARSADALQDVLALAWYQSIA